jgi:glycosyltransferase involved in cell wall biosynthesis
MVIGFDAKRAYHNNTGLGNYSRTLIDALARYFPAHDYRLFNPKPSTLYRPSAPNVREILPATSIDRAFPAYWRSVRVSGQLQAQGIQLFHGLSHELPRGIEDTGIPTVITMHDLIQERYPEQYGWIDRKIYGIKLRHAARAASLVIAISNQTKEDVEQYLGVPSARIRVCYQSCNPIYREAVAEEKLQEVRRDYGLPDRYFLSVGSIIERKNLLRICEAMALLKGKLDIPLVVIGSWGGAYKRKVEDFLQVQGLRTRVFFISDNPLLASRAGYRSSADLPAIYRQAVAMLYPSSFEGFGIPVLEALCCGLPVITSNRSSLPEAGGPGSIYVDPDQPQQIADAMYRVSQDDTLVARMRAAGLAYAEQFREAVCAERVTKVYEESRV